MRLTPFRSFPFAPGCCAFSQSMWRCVVPLRHPSYLFQLIFTVFHPFSRSFSLFFNSFSLYSMAGEVGLVGNVAALMHCRLICCTWYTATRCPRTGCTRSSAGTLPKDRKLDRSACALTTTTRSWRRATTASVTPTTTTVSIATNSTRGHHRTATSQSTRQVSPRLTGHKRKHWLS